MYVTKTKHFVWFSDIKKKWQPTTTAICKVTPFQCDSRLISLLVIPCKDLICISKIIFLYKLPKLNYCYHFFTLKVNIESLQTILYKVTPPFFWKRCHFIYFFTIFSQVQPIPSYSFYWLVMLALLSLNPATYLP